MTSLKLIGSGNGHNIRIFVYKYREGVRTLLS